jgi:putative DNA methylase
VLQEVIAKAVGAGRELHLESVDFSDPHRPKTCFEVDFPILPINTIATIEGKWSGAKARCTRLSKWWATTPIERLSPVAYCCRDESPQMIQPRLLSSYWDSYYGNHQKNEAFRKLKVADIFHGWRHNCR